MIVSNIYFDTAIRTDVVRRLFQLSEPLRPTEYSEGEKSTRTTINPDQFILMQGKYQGYFLHSKAVLYYINTLPFGITNILSQLLIDDYKLFSEKYFDIIAKCKIHFGFASSDLEYEHRNRHFWDLDENSSIETWVGRDLSKYLPGIYWKTFVSDELTIRHQVRIDIIESMSPKYTKTDFGVSFSFFDNPNDWKKNVKKLDDLCYALDGFFSMRDLEGLISKEMNYFEVNSILSQWS